MVANSEAYEQPPSSGWARKPQPLGHGHQSAGISLPAPIPRGVADYFWEEGQRRRAVEDQLLSLFRSWGYGDVISPLFEYADTIAARSTPELQAGMMRFVDRDGSTLALRSDMTIGVARLVGTRLHDWPMPQRFCYAGSVFRHTETQAGQQREFYQVGIELIGAANPLADAEVLALTTRALELCGLPHVRLAVGHLGYFHGLLQELDLSPVLEEQLLNAIDHNSGAALAAFLQAASLRPETRRTVEELPCLSGNDAREVLAHAGRLCLNDAMSAALENLEAILDAHARLGARESVYLDLTEIHDLGYYTGITFEALTPQIGFPVAGGGRYDQLVGSFGPPQPAVGVALTLDRILLARKLQGSQPVSLTPIPTGAPFLVVATRNDPVCLSLLDLWRQHGVHVAIDVAEKSESALHADARRVGADYALVWQGDGFRVFEAAPEGSQNNVDFVAATDALKWINAMTGTGKVATP